MSFIRQPCSSVRLQGMAQHNPLSRNTLRVKYCRLRSYNAAHAALLYKSSEYNTFAWVTRKNSHRKNRKCSQVRASNPLFYKTLPTSSCGSRLYEDRMASCFANYHGFNTLEEVI